MAEVETTRDGAVLTITLNRPDVLNAFNAALHRALAAALEEARADDVRAVVITGAGRGFCVGQDLTEFREAPGDIGDRLRSNYHPNILALRALEKPVLAAVNGPAAGAGLSFACACDLRLAAESATFVPAFINIGLVPDSGGTYFVRRLLGTARAFEWMTSGRRLGAVEALEWGLVSEVVEDDRLAERAAERAAELAAMPDARRGPDEAALRPRRERNARGAARARGPAPGRRHADGRLPRGRRRLPRKARPALHRPLVTRRPERYDRCMENTASLSSTSAVEHPVRVVVNDDLQRTRLTVFFRLILAIPLFLWAMLWGAIAVLALLVNWFATLFTGRSPDGVHNFLATFLRYTTHVRAYTLLIADPYPGFTGAQAYPIDLEVAPPQPQSRLTVFFRIILAIPALFVSNILSNLSQLLAVFSWFIALVTGRVPEGLRNFAVLALRFETQTYAYVLLLTERYPSFNVGIES